MHLCTWGEWNTSAFVAYVSISLHDLLKKKKGLGFFGSVTAVGETQCDLQNSQKDLGRAEVVIEL